MKFLSKEMFDCRNNTLIELFRAEIGTISRDLSFRFEKELYIFIYFFFDKISEQLLDSISEHTAHTPNSPQHIHI